MIPNAIKKSVERKLSCRYNANITILKTTSISGGCINNSAKIKTTNGVFFLKWHEDPPIKMFQSEYNGLMLLKKTKTIFVPEVLSVDDNFLILPFIPPGLPNSRFWKTFGIKLAKLHKVNTKQFGLSINNYIGSLNQRNTQHKDWATFFIEARLKEQLHIGAFSKKLLSDFDKLFQKIPSIFPEEPPSLIHGDLWIGNVIINQDNMPTLIDPAVYYGHREMDIAMSKLFGGFHDQFYSSYNENYPLSDGWQERVDICNLYPLLVHVNLFGGGYYSQVKTILSRVL